jgi:hypothetical protein
LLAACSLSGQRLKLATGTQGGTWYPLGGAIKSIVEALLQCISVQVVPGGGIANVLAVEKGRAQVADQFGFDGRRHPCATAMQSAGDACMQCRRVVSAVFPGDDAGRCQSREPEDLRGKVLGADVRHYRRSHHRPSAKGVRIWCDRQQATMF